MTAQMPAQTPPAVRPLYDYLLVTHARRSNRIGLLYVPDNAREDMQRGDVVAVGEGAVMETGERLPLKVKVGDHILWAKAWEKPVDIGKETYAAVRERDIIGIVDTAADSIAPLYNTVVIRADALQDRAGSLYLPMQTKVPLMPAMTGTILDCGPGHRRNDGTIEALDVKPGDRVLFEAYGGEDHEFAGEKVRLIPEEHVLAVISQEQA